MPEVLPPQIKFGHAAGRLLLAVADGDDVGELPDALVPTGATVTFTPSVELRVTDPQLHR